MKQKETIRSLWTPTAGMLTGARRAAMLLLTTLLLTMTAQTAWAQEEVELQSSDGNVTLEGGDYVVNGDVTINGNITANNPVNLTISNGATLSVGGHIEGGDITIDVQGGSFIGQTCSINVRNSQNATIEAGNVYIIDGTTITNSTIVSGVILAYGGTFSGSNVTVNSYLQLLGEVVFDASNPGVSINVSEYVVNGGSLTISNGSLKDGDGNIYEEGPVANPSVLNGKTLTYYNASSEITVSLNAQGGSGGTESVTPASGEAMPTITPPTRTGYTFGGYYTEQNGGGTQYYNADGTSAQVCDLTGTVVLYAKWTANTYTVTFDRQGGSGGTESVNNATFGSAMPAITPPTRTDCQFVGYYTGVNGGGTKYYNADGTSARTWGIDANTTLYAYWKKSLSNSDITIEIPAQPYNGSELTPVVTVYDNDYEVSDEHYTVTLPEGRTNAGDYTIEIHAKEGSTAYFGGTLATFTISRKAVTITAGSDSRTYDGTALNKNTFTATPLESGDTHTFTVEMTSESTITDVGTQPNVIAKVDGVAVETGEETIVGNYLVTTVNGTLTVNPVIVRVSVVDKADGKPIVGNQVVVQNSKGVIEHEWNSTEENHEISVLKAGGEYTIIGNAYLGYTRSAEYTLTIGENGNVSSYSGTITQDDVLLVESGQTHVEFSVVDMVDGDKLAGATVQVIDSDNKVVEEWTSGTENHIINGLFINEVYTLRETVAPNRYAAPAAYTFTIDETGKVTTTDGTTITDESGNTVLLVENPFTVPLFAANSSNLWMTWCDEYDYVKPDGVTVYTVSGVENNTVTLAEVSDVIPAYTPVLLCRETAGNDAVTATFSAVGTAPASGYDSSSGIVEANLSDNVTLYGNSGEEAYASGSDNNIYAISDLSDTQSYVLLDGQFVLVDYDEGISAHRCWLNVAKSTTNGARLLSINTDSESTGIETTNFTNSANSSGAWYGIDGRKLDGKPTKKGLYIYNGKKQVIK